MVTLWLVSFGICSIVIWLADKFFRQSSPTRKLPPGPPKLPLLGNVLDLRNGLDWELFTKLGRQYDSDVIHLGALGKSIVVLNSYKAAQDLLDQRSGIYSSRPFSTMLHELSGWDKLFTFAQYGDHWRAARKIFTKHFRVSNTVVSQPREVFYVRRFLGQLLDNPNKLKDHIHHLVGSITISMTYGLQTLPVNDPHLTLAEDALVYLGNTGVGNYLVDLVPVLKYVPAWFPGATFQKIAEKNKYFINTIRDTCFEAAKQRMDTIECAPSFVSEALQDIEHSKSPEEELALIKLVSSQVYIGVSRLSGIHANLTTSTTAAVDTTTASISSFFLAMVCYPDVQKKLQKELDRVLQGRLPVQKDFESLPYLDAVLMEVLRWEPAGPIGVPHSVIADDVYNGYHIPKDSIVIANLWAMLTDPEVYPEPTEFKPERFLKNGKIDESVRSPITTAFGFGRRECPGRHIAMSTLKMTMASVLSSFDILKKTGADGKVIEPTREYPFSLVRHPKDIGQTCDIRPRSRSAEEGIRAWASMEGERPP